MHRDNVSMVWMTSEQYASHSEIRRQARTLAMLYILLQPEYHLLGVPTHFLVFLNKHVVQYQTFLERSSHIVTKHHRRQAESL